MKIIYAGDVHGKIPAIQSIDAAAKALGADAVVQCGDFGIFWPHSQGEVARYFIRRANRGTYTVPWYFCDGNHDVHDRLDEIAKKKGGGLVEVAPGLTHVRRGEHVTIGGVVHAFCGGARSTDRGPGEEFYMKKRIWWPQEAPSGQELTKFLDTIEAQKPEVVVTHEAPLRVPLWRIDRESDPTSRGLENILHFSAHKPKAWFFGHHHTLGTWESGETTLYNAGLHGQGWVRDSSTREVIHLIKEAT